MNFMEWGKSTSEVMSTARKLNLSKTLVIISGGMDSATCLGLAKSCSKEVGCITFDYGQTHSKEIICAREVGWEYQADVKTIDLNNLASNFVTALSKDSDIEIPDGATSDVPPTYVPFRNTIMLAIAAGYAQSWGYTDIFYGANIIDYSGYPDCRPEYIAKVNEVIKTHTNDIFVHAPIVYLTKADVVRLGEEVGVPWDKTWSCYRGGLNACGKCPSCEYRLLGFGQTGIKDPIAYDEGVETWPQKT